MARQSKKVSFFIATAEAACLSMAGVTMDVLILYGMTATSSISSFSLPPLPWLGFNVVTLYLWWALYKAAKLQSFLGYLDYENLFALRRSRTALEALPESYQAYAKKYLPYCLWVTNSKTRWGIRFLLIALALFVLEGLALLPMAAFVIGLAFCFLAILKIAQGIMDVV